MNIQKTFTSKSFKNSLIAISLILFGIVCALITHNTQIQAFSLLVGLSILISSVFGIIGLSQIVKGRKEKKTIKFYFSLTVNSLICILIIFLIVANIIDIMNAFF